MVATNGGLGCISLRYALCLLYMFDESLKRIQENFPERPQVTYYIWWWLTLVRNFFFYKSNDGAMVSTNGGIRCVSQRYIFCLLSIINIMWISMMHSCYEMVVCGNRLVPYSQSETYSGKMWWQDASDEYVFSWTSFWCEKLFEHIHECETTRRIA